MVHGTLLIGVGNEYRRDDGLGLAIARQLQTLWLPGVEVREATGEGGALLEYWQGAERVYIADAVYSGAPAGTVHRLDAAEQPVPTGFFNYSTHAFSLAEAVEMARVLGRLPRTLVIYGVEGADFGSGAGLTPAVARAAAEVVARIRGEIIAA